MAVSSNIGKQKNGGQPSLFSEDRLYPETLPRLHELRPSHHLSAIFEDCHNYIYANEGLLKDKIFHEVVKLLVMKLCDEQSSGSGVLRFGITANEYRRILEGQPDTFESRLRELFDEVRGRYPRLFTDRALILKPLTLAYVVGRLQYVSLSDTPGDVKGEAFQVFVTRHQRGDRGEFFTPHPIVRLAVETMNPRPDEKVIDPACGSGGFLLQTIAYIRQSNPVVNTSEYIRKNIVGIEFNPDVALSATVRFAFEGGEGTEIFCANALIEDEERNETFDLVLTNPPFGSKGKVEDRDILEAYTLAHRWEKSHSDSWKQTPTMLARQSPEILFIEKCLKLLRPGGRLAIVLPDGILQNVSNSHIRHWIRSQAQVLGVVSIPQEAFIPYGTGIKTSLLLVQKLPADTNRSCFMARIRKIGYDVKGQLVYKRDSSGRLARTPSGYPVVDDDIDDIVSAFRAFELGTPAQSNENIYLVPEETLNSRLDAEHYQPDDRELVDYLMSVGAKPLGEIADILSETDDFRLEGDAEIRYIAIGDVDARTMQVVSQQIIKANEAPSRARYRLMKGDIITAVSGASTGTKRHATAFITEDEDGAICSNGFVVLRNVHGVEPLFLLAYLRTDYFLRQVRRLMTGHAIPAISASDLSNVLVAIPSRDEQERIAHAIAAIQSMRKEALRAGESVVANTEELLNRL